MPTENSDRKSGIVVARRVAGQFSALPQVEAVALSGSRTSEFADPRSDIDLYVYVTEDIPLDMRANIAAGSPQVEIGNATWEKRLLQHAKASCTKLPRDIERLVTELLASVGKPDSGTAAKVSILLDGLDELLLGEEMVPQQRRP